MDSGRLPFEIDGARSVTPVGRTVLLEKVPQRMVDWSMWQKVEEKFTREQITRMRYQQYIQDHFFVPPGPPGGSLVQAPPPRRKGR